MGYPPLSELGDPQRREFHEALLDADSFEDLPGKWQAAILRPEQNPAEPAGRVGRVARPERGLRTALAENSRSNPQWSHIEDCDGQVPRLAQ